MITTAVALFAELVKDVPVPRNQYLLTVIFDLVIALFIGDP